MQPPVPLPGPVISLTFATGHKKRWAPARMVEHLNELHLTALHITLGSLITFSNTKAQTKLLQLFDEDKKKYVLLSE